MVRFSFRYLMDVLSGNAGAGVHTACGE